MLEFCTYFDRRYLSRGLALYYSLQRHCSDFRLWVLALDEVCERTLRSLNLDNLVILSLRDIEVFDPDFLAVKETRSLVEYYFTSTPVLLNYIFEMAREVDFLTYLDADLYFMHSPSALVTGSSGSVQIVPHRYSAANKHLEKWGLYNVGWVSFRRDDWGFACLAWWRKSCISWCYDHIDGDRFADQKYLDAFPKFRGVEIIHDECANLAPWNVRSNGLTLGDDGNAYYEGRPIIFFHFHRFREIAPRVWRTYLSYYGSKTTPKIRRLLYRPYIIQLRAAERLLKEYVENKNIESALLGAAVGRLRRVSALRSLLAGVIRRELLIG